MNKKQKEKLNKAIDKMLEASDSPKMLGIVNFDEPIALAKGDTLQITWNIKTSK
jgi:hypothetical protein